MSTILLLLLYSISYGLALLNDGIFQDDWTLYNMRPDIIRDIYHDQGHRWLAYLHNYLLSFQYSIQVYHLITFTAYLSAALFFNGALKKIKEINNYDRFLLVAVFALFPVNSVRFLMINLPYALCYALFFGGVWCLAQYSASLRIGYRITALILFFVSFDTNSLLAFYTIPVLWYLAERGRAIRRLYKYPDFLAIPFLYWIPKTHLFPPQGAWEGYNAITIITALKAPVFLILSYYTSFLKVLDQAVLSLNSLTLITALLIAMMLVRRLPEKESPLPNTSYNYALLFGVIAFAAAVIPYNLVGLLPKLEYWHSRHQLLTPLGASFLIVYGWSAIAERLRLSSFLRVWVIALVLCLFTAANMKDAVVFHTEWYKQQAMISKFKQDPVIAANTTFLIDDRTASSESRRYYPVYHYAGMLKQTFSDERRIGIDINSLETRQYRDEVNRFRKYFTEKWNAGEYTPAAELYRVVIEPGPYKADRLSKVLSLKRHQLLNPPIYRERLEDLVTITCYRVLP